MLREYLQRDGLLQQLLSERDEMRRESRRSSSESNKLEQQRDDAIKAAARLQVGRVWDVGWRDGGSVAVVGTTSTSRIPAPHEHKHMTPRIYGIHSNKHHATSQSHQPTQPRLPLTNTHTPPIMYCLVLSG